MTADRSGDGEVPAGDDRVSLAVWKFASCDGCQLTLLDCEDELLAVADRFRFAHFLEASSAVDDGPFDVSLVEGSITTADDVSRIHDIRERSAVLVTIGACANAGGVQALRNLADVDVDELRSIVYPSPELISTLASSTPIADHVEVDLELPGCPIDRNQLLEVLAAFLAGRAPNLPTTSVCVECKARDLVCVAVAGAEPCLGPVTRSGCGALCPSVGRGCYGCFGPAEAANTSSLVERLRGDGVDDGRLTRLLHTFNAWAPGFRDQPVAVADPTRSGR